jgi:hypothetical protein
MIWRQAGNANAYRRQELLAIYESDRRGERRADAFENRLDCFALTDVFKQDDELVPPVTRYVIALSDAIFKAPSHFTKDVITDVMAMAVVDGLEIVEVDKKHGGIAVVGRFHFEPNCESRQQESAVR